MASAWLILRFIDPAANFLWLEKPEDCPDDALLAAVGGVLDGIYKNFKTGESI